MGKFKKVLIGMIVITLLFVVGFVGTLIWLQSKSNSSAKENDFKNQKTVVHKIESPIISNLKGQSKVYIRVVVELKLKDNNKDDKKFFAALSEDDGDATTAIIEVFRSKTVEEVSEPNAPTQIGREITKELNRIYNTDKFVTTNYREFITQ